MVTTPGSVLPKDWFDGKIETFGTRGMPVRIRLPQQDMTREQCQHCGRHSYSDGRCYADRKMKGRPISDYCYCDWAKPPYELPGKLLKRSRTKKNENKSNH